MKNVSILGSTGSIGTQTLDVIRRNADINVVGTLSYKVMTNAIIKVVSASVPTYNLKSAQSFL